MNLDKNSRFGALKGATKVLFDGNALASLLWMRQHQVEMLGKTVEDCSSSRSEMIKALAEIQKTEPTNEKCKC